MPASSRSRNKSPAFFGLLLISFALHAQTSFKVESEKTLRVDAPGAIDAYSLDSSCAEATLADGTVIITGRIPGSTHIVVVLPSGTLAWDVLVARHPVRRWNDSPDDDADLKASGYYGTAYNSSPGEAQEEFDLTRRGDDGTTIRTRLIGTRLLPGTDMPGASLTQLSSGSYQISTPSLDLTLLDKMLDESPLTSTNSIIRGIHFREDGWFVHAGFTSIEAFEGLFLPIRSEGMFEGGYSYQIGEHDSLTGAVTYFDVPRTQLMGRSGAMGRLAYEYKPREGFRFSADLGLSRGVGAASRLDYRDEHNTLRARFQYAPPGFAELSATNLRGIRSDLSWVRRISNALQNSMTLYSNDLTLPGLTQNSLTLGNQLEYRFASHWSLIGGATGAWLRTQVPAVQTVFNLTAPAGLRFHSRYLTADGQYEFTRVTEQDTGGKQYRFSATAGGGPLSIMVMGQRQVQAPSLSFVLAQAPGLQESLDQLGTQASSIQQVNELLNDTAYLFAAGYIKGATINLVPVRDQLGASLNWNHSGRYPRQLSYNFLLNDDHNLTSNSISAGHSLMFSQRIGAEEFSLIYSAMQIRTAASAPDFRQVFSVAWRHHVTTVPDFVIPERHGVIAGVAFRDDEAKGVYAQGMPPIAGARITLDGSRVIETAADGSFRFVRVPAGKHKLAISYSSEKPAFFSTSSEVEVTENSAVNFGITFVTPGVMGRVVNDANQGIADVRITIRGEDRSWTAVTDGAGDFFVRQVPDGEYIVEAKDDTIPPGYPLSDLTPQTVTAKGTTPGSAMLRLRALRAVGGRVLAFNAAAGKQAPVAGQVVTLKATGGTGTEKAPTEKAGAEKTSTTDASGHYLFRDLPAGSYTVTVGAAGRETTHSVTLPPGPMTLLNVDLQMEASPAK